MLIITEEIIQTSIMHSWDYVDPKIASKHAQIHRQINDLKAKREQISANHKLSKSAKQKLLEYNHSCLQDLQALLEGYKEDLVDYLDRQVNALTNQEVKQRNAKQSRQDKSLEMTRLDFSGENSENTSSFLNKTHVMNQSRENQSFIENSKTTKRHKRIKSFEFNPCSANPHQQPQNQKVMKKKATVTRVMRKRMSHKLMKKQKQLKISQFKCQTLAFQLSQMYTENAENNELIELLHRKIEILQNQNRGAKKEKDRESELSVKLVNLQRKYEQLERVQYENQELMMQRREAMKSLQRIKNKK